MKKIQFTTVIHRFQENADKTGWSYIIIPADLAEELKPGHRRSYRVKGKLDLFPIAGVSILPVKDGTFMLPINGNMRKGTGKKVGAMLNVQLQEDKTPFEFNKDFLECLQDEPRADAFFRTLTGSHQRYFSKRISDAKTDQTRTRRIADAVTALSREMGYGEMLRSLKKQ